MKTQVTRLFAIAACLIVAAALAVGFILVGSPGHARLVRLDQRRVEDLKALRSSVQAFETARRRLPQSLGEIAKATANAPDATAPTLTDPVTRRAYEYRPTGAVAYVLCATFAAAARDDAEGGGLAVAADPDDQAPDFWAHPQGRHCFSLTVSVPEPAATPAANATAAKP